MRLKSIPQGSKLLIAETPGDLGHGWQTIYITGYLKGLNINRYDIDPCYVYCQEDTTIPKTWNSRIRNVYVPLALHQEMISHADA